LTRNQETKRRKKKKNRKEKNFIRGGKRPGGECIEGLFLAAHQG